MSRDPCDRLDDIIERIDAATKAEHLLAQAEAANNRELASTLINAILLPGADHMNTGLSRKSIAGISQENRDRCFWFLTFDCGV